MSSLLITLIVCGIIGIFSIVSIIAYLFTTLGKNVEELQIESKIPSPADGQLLYDIAASSGSAPVHFPVDDEIVTDNEVFFQKLCDDIDSAKHHIAIATYVWDDDSFSKKLFTKLESAVKRDVMVRLLFDGHGSDVSKETISRLRSAGIKCSTFRPLQLGGLSVYMARTHRRVYLFDHTHGYIGGSAITRKWFTNKLKDDHPYSDVMYRVTGELLSHLAGSFGELWAATTGEIPLAIASAENKRKPNEQINSVYLSHSPRKDIHQLSYFFWTALFSAKREIFICTPYFVPGKVIRALLLQKQKAGVQVTILTQGTSEIPYVQAASRSHYPELLESGVRIYEHTKPHLHTKLALIDSDITILGSANIDIRSQRINQENVLAVQSQPFTIRNWQYVSTLLQDSKQITHSEFEKYPLYRRAFDKLILQLSEQL